MARTYHRDARGRFASGGGGSGGGGRKAVKLPAPVRRTVGSRPQQRRGLLIQRAAVGSSRRKLAAMDPADTSYTGSLRRRAQKAAVTRASNKLQAAKAGGRVRLSGRVGVIRPGKKRATAVPPQDAPTSNRGKKASRGRQRLAFYSSRKDGVMLKKAVVALKNGSFKPGDLEGNIRAVRQMAEEKGYETKRGRSTIAPASFNVTGRSGQPSRVSLTFSAKASHWEDPVAGTREQRRTRWWSSSAPTHAMWHEIGHAKQHKAGKGSYFSNPLSSTTKTSKIRSLIEGRKVSKYASTSPDEFVAETYAALRAGRRFDRGVMTLYRELMGTGDSALKARRSRRR